MNWPSTREAYEEECGESTMTEHSFNMDAYAPAEIAMRVETVGVGNANFDAATMFALAVLAGAFLALGANVATMP